MVIVHHINNIADKIGIVSPILDHLGGVLSYSFAGFFMQTFFLLNGFTSNFNKPFKLYLWGSFKGLIIPCIAFSIIFKFLNGICFGDWALWVTVAQGDQTWFFLDESYWFLTALFFARLLYWSVSRYVKNEWVKVLIMFSVLILGTWMNNIMDGQVNWPSHWNNHLHYRNAMCMAIFIWTGDLIKKIKNKIEPYYKYMAVLYTSGLAVGIITHHLGIITAYTHSSFMTLTQIPLYLFFATFGSITMIWISKIIGHNKILEYYGRGSIVVYMVHFFFLTITIKTLSKAIYPAGVVSTVTFFVVIFIVVSLLCAGMIWLLKKPYLRKLIGR